MAKSIRRKQLKEPDEFLTLTSRFVEFSKRRERELTIGAAALAVLIALVVGVRWYRASRSARAEAAFGAAQRDFKAQKLEAAATAFARVSSSWPATTYGELARIYLGNVYAELGKTAEAEGAFSDALAHASEPLLRQLAEYNLGVLRLKAGDKPGAATALGNAAGIEGPLRGTAWFARLDAGQPFVENAQQGMQALEDLPPDQKAYVEKHLGPGGPPPSEGAEAPRGE